MKNVRYAMAKGMKKKSTHGPTTLHDKAASQRQQLTDRPMKSDLPNMLRGDTWPGQKTVMGQRPIIKRK
jgi:hypothetical protein